MNNTHFFRGDRVEHRTSPSKGIGVVRSTRSTRVGQLVKVRFDFCVGLFLGEELKLWKSSLDLSWEDFLI